MSAMGVDSLQEDVATLVEGIGDALSDWKDAWANSTTAIFSIDAAASFDEFGGAGVLPSLLWALVPYPGLAPWPSCLLAYILEGLVSFFILECIAFIAARQDSSEGSRRSSLAGDRGKLCGFESKRVAVQCKGLFNLLGQIYKQNLLFACYRRSVLVTVLVFVAITLLQTVFILLLNWSLGQKVAAWARCYLVDGEETCMQWVPLTSEDNEREKEAAQKKWKEDWTKLEQVGAKALQEDLLHGGASGLKWHLAGKDVSSPGVAPTSRTVLSQLEDEGCTELKNDWLAKELLVRFRSGCPFHSCSPHHIRPNRTAKPPLPRMPAAHRKLRRGGVDGISDRESAPTPLRQGGSTPSRCYRESASHRGVVLSASQQRRHPLHSRPPGHAEGAPLAASSPG
jgi:hypothetical protein